MDYSRYILFLVLEKNSVDFKVKLTCTKFFSITGKLFLKIFGFLLVKLFKCLFIRTQNHFDFVLSYQEAFNFFFDSVSLVFSNFTFDFNGRPSRCFATSSFLVLSTHSECTKLFYIYMCCILFRIIYVPNARLIFIDYDIKK